MKKFKLMLVAFMAMVGVNAMAQGSDPSSSDVLVGEEPSTSGPRQTTKDGVIYIIKDGGEVLDETGRSVNNIVYNLKTVTWTAKEGTATFTTKEAEVMGVNTSAADADVATLAIPAKVTGDKGEYNVLTINEAWENNAGLKLKNVTALTTTLSIDVTNLDKAMTEKAYDGFTKLQSLTITDSNAAADAKTTVFAGGFAADAKETLTTVTLTGSNINEIAKEAFKGCIALTGFDFGTKITGIGQSAFEGCYGFTTLTIPATVIAIGEDAFKGMYYKKDDKTAAVGLTTLVVNGAQNTYKADKSLESSVIPAAFSGNQLLNSVTIGSTTATEIASGAFTDATHLEVLDLSAATELATITGAFAASDAFKTIKLAGTKLTSINDLNISKSNRTLATLTLPAGLTSLESSKFKYFIALKELDLSGTKVTVIPTTLIGWNEVEATQELDAEGKPVADKYIAPALTTVKLNPATTKIGDYAFFKQSALTTVEGLNQEKLTSIGKQAFRGTGLTTVDLSATKLTTILGWTFAEMEKLETVKLPETIEEIETAAFCYDAKVNSINLEDTKIKTLNTIFHKGIAGTYMSDPTTVVPVDPSPYSDGSEPSGPVEKKGDKEVAIALTSLTLPETLEEIADGALQLLDITEITIPESVTSIGAYALQGCIKLEKFTWNNAQSREIAVNAFRGDDKLKEVKMVTNDDTYTGLDITGEAPAGESAPDAIFKGNNKSALKFIVNVEDYNMLVARGWTEANLKYCTLTTEGASEFEFKAAGKYGEYYYATYYNADQATWFPADKFEVFGAVVEGSNVVMKPFTVEGGYYKVAKIWDVCVIRSKEQKAEYELKNADFNDISTAPLDNELEVAREEFTPSRLKYQYKFGVKNGVVAFYRVTSGKIKEGGVYIEASVAAARLNIIFEGEGDATAIQAIATEAENTGAIYNLNGVRVNKAQKGVYIQNGNKFVK